MKLVEIRALYESGGRLYEASSEEISDFIRWLRNDWIYKKGLSLWDIGNGYCEEFAAVVIKKFPDAIEVGNFNFMEGENGEEDENDVWDKIALEAYNSLPPIPIKQLNQTHFGQHVWVYSKVTKRHYDAEKPEGVSNFWRLPFFQRQLYRRG